MSKIESKLRSDYMMFSAVLCLDNNTKFNSIEQQLSSLVRLIIFNFDHSN